MATNLRVGDPFPAIELPNHNGKLEALRRFTRPSDIDERLGFEDGYPLIVVFYRGFSARAISSRCGCWFSSKASSRLTTLSWWRSAPTLPACRPRFGPA